MSLSAFHAHFREVTATSPIRYQKTLRLIEAQRLLRVSGAQVGTVAREVGYASPTQFSRDYAREFGVSPRVDRAA